MSIININGKDLDLGTVGAIEVAYHTQTEEQASAAIKAVAEFTGDTKFEPYATGTTVWLRQYADVSNAHEEDARLVEFTIFLPGMRNVDLNAQNARNARIFAQQVLGEFV